MNHYQKYLIEEFADDYNEKLLTRRQLLRRAFFIMGSIPAAAAALAAVGCGDDDDVNQDPTDVAATPTGASASTTAATTAPGTAAASPAATPDLVKTNTTFKGPASDLLGYVVSPPGTARYPGILIIHENRGLNDHTKNVAERFAAQGFVALAVDLVSRNGGSLKDPDRNTGFLAQTPPADLVADLAGYATALAALPNVRAGGVGVTGFCFGGGYTWESVATIPSVMAGVPYYGTCNVIDKLATTRAAVLAIYAERDTRITGQSEQVKASLAKNGRPSEVRIYPGTDHAFFNDTGTRYNAEAAKDAFTRTVAWFKQHLPSA